MPKREPGPEALLSVAGTPQVRQPTTIASGSTWGPWTAVRKCASAGSVIVRCGACGTERPAFGVDLVDGKALGCRGCGGSAGAPSPDA